MINREEGYKIMQKLFTNYSTGQIIIFIIIIAIAVKELLTLIDWFKDRARKQIKQQDMPIELQQATKRQDKELNEIRDCIKDLTKNTQLLMDSDRQSIKYSITKQHHYFVYQLGYIDDYSLDILEKRYSYYLSYGGNSYVGTLIDELRELPKGPIDDVK